MKTLSDYTDAEITREYFRRMVSKLGDPRASVGASSRVSLLRIENARLRDEIAIRDLAEGKKT